MDYIQTLKDLLSIDTTVPPGNNYEKAIDFLNPLFKQTDCQTEKVFIPKEHCDGHEGRVNLIAHRRSPGKKRVIFYTHVDVVPAKGWDAFTPRIENGRIYARGASDMKGQIVSLIMALEKLKGRTLNYDLSAVVTVDEEVGHAEGNEIRYLRPYLEPVEGADFFSLDAGAGYVQVAALGVYAIEITVHGKSVHQGRAYLGENAVENAIKLCLPLMKLGDEISTRKSKIPTEPGVGLEYMQGNLTITMIHGGIKANIVPDECVISLARRIAPGEDINTVEKEVLDTLHSVPNVRYDIKRILHTPPFPPTYDEPEADKLDAIVRAVTGAGGKFGMMGSLPLDPVGFEWKAKIFGTGVSGPEQNIHGINEFAYLKDIENLAEIIERFVTT